MAKENSYPPVLLCLASALFMTGGWLMSSFPVFIFFGLAPLFALTDRAGNTVGIWEKMEWVLLSLAVNFLAARTFDFSFTASSVLYAILFTLPFVGHVWVKQTLGNRAGKITIILFWLAAEYLLLKIDPQNSIFLADAIGRKLDWVGWNIHTGYLGSSLWILLINLLVYQLFLSKTPFQWYWFFALIVVVAGPLAYSFSQDRVIVRADMLYLYATHKHDNVTYLARGEFVVRTAAWVSTLIILFTFIKGQTTKR